jgi:DNA helicase-2/ATP-dependent DNA helicase PcrA
MSLLDGLNPAQKEAVTLARGPLLILAGAGTGKTRVLTHRVAHLVQQGVGAWRLLAVTFTNKAAAEMRERLGHLCGHNAERLWVGTFHAIAAKLLRIHGREIGVDPGFAIFDEDDQRRVILRLMKDAGAGDRVTPRQVLSRIDQLKNRGIGPSDRSGLGASPIDDLVGRVYAPYEAALRRENAVDFGDLLLLGLRLVTASSAGDLLRERFTEVLVDEFQDTNRVQYDLVRGLTRDERRLVVVGDDDQAIYAWRGADVGNILDFPRDFPEAPVVRLERNYRSSGTILDAANAVIAKSTRRLGKTLYTDRDAGELVLLLQGDDEHHEAEQIANAIRRLIEMEGRSPRDFAVLYRTHAQSRVLEEVLRASRTPFVIIGGVGFYARREIKDLLSYLRLASPEPPRDLDVERVINVPTRGIGEGTLERLTAVRNQLWPELPLLEAARRVTQPGEPSAENALPTAGRRRVREFVELVDELRAEAITVAPSVLAMRILARTNMETWLAGDGGAEGRERIDNVRELVAALADYEQRAVQPTLIDFLEQAALQSPTDGSATHEGAGQVSLMTIHAAKGLEFPIVIVAGLEEGVFPALRRSGLWNALEADPQEIDEERRLAYVAFTRARDRLIVTFAGRRRLYDSFHTQEPSRFLHDLPRELVAVARAPRAPVRPQVRPSFTRPAPPAPRRDPGEVYVEYDDAPLRVGALVRHERFGLGTVRSASGEGKDVKLRVDFGSEGEKTVLARFVQPA